MLLMAKIALGLAGTAVAGAGLLCSEGLIEVNVVEKQPEQHHVFVVAPAMIVPLGMHFAPKRELAKASREVQPWLPTIRAAMEELRRCKDMTLVEVNDHEQHVRVAKQGGAIVVDVKDEEDLVHVSAPVRAIASAIEELAASSSGPDSGQDESD
jgi:hypothetical protein